MKQGFTVVNTEVWGIPYDKDETVVFFDIEGKPLFEEPMTDLQKQNIGKLFAEPVDAAKAKKNKAIEKELFPDDSPI